MRSRRLLYPTLLLALLFLVVPAALTMAQDSGAILSNDMPTEGKSFIAGENVVYAGWAAHPSGPGTGIDRVAVYDAPMGAGGKLVAEAMYGLPRPDVAAVQGASWTNSGFEASEPATGSGNVTRWVYAHSPSNNGWTNKTITFRVTGQAPAPTPEARSDLYDRFRAYGPGFGDGPYGGFPGFGDGPYGGFPRFGGMYARPFSGAGFPFNLGAPLFGAPFGAPYLAGPSYGSMPFPPSSAAVPNVTVSMVPGAYSPATVNVPIGGTVRWTNGDATNPHTATSDARLWDSGAVFPGQSYAYTFTTAGTYTYYCSFHGHRGTIVVP